MINCSLYENLHMYYTHTHPPTHNKSTIVILHVWSPGNLEYLLQMWSCSVRTCSWFMRYLSYIYMQFPSVWTNLWAQRFKGLKIGHYFVPQAFFVGVEHIILNHMVLALRNSISTFIVHASDIVELRKTCSVWSRDTD